ncbi:SAV_2336 N-terminal domain-related protein [Actinomadura decatromicini]|uniref:FtsK domain-containing protein n=1 Tax=Actinomadura decatromicini TaxID=2604572 RepID=A0A5D3FMT3_9ACTN|nr:SAV_2336 N-terminal domain-related protein [Actinomadura decatromicini]TYK49226.1 hypothetical protein FXF68_15615 [Actinomadura decatromicini]
MTIDRLRDALSAIGPPPDARELSEILWLACHITPSEDAPPREPLPAVPQVIEEAPPLPDTVPRPRPEPEPLSPLHPRAAPETPGEGAAVPEPVGEATEVLVPTAPMLADPLGVQRALRPLKRRVPSRHRFGLDEDATAARIADTGVWTPVLVPEPERWLSLTLVVDTGPTMRLWRPLARELTETLLRQGAFQDVHVAYLDTTGGVAAIPDAPRQDPGTLLDASGRRAVLVLSDCSGPHWWDGRAARAVRRWAQTGPTAILQPLAERLWRRTAAPAAPGVAVLPRPGAPNADLRFVPYDGDAKAGVPVPVLEVAPRWFGAWARLVSGSDPQPAAVATLPARPPAAAVPVPVRRERELPVEERVRRFLATASADAAELAAHVAVSVPSLPVMRLIQHRILGGSGPGQLAEVLLSGLLRSVGGVRYEFVPGAREALLDTLPRPEALHTRHVLEAVSAEIERRAGTAAERFRALLPTDGGPVKLTADTDHFALLTPETRSHLATAPAGVPDPLEPRETSDPRVTPADGPRLIWDLVDPMFEAIGTYDNGGTTQLDFLYGGEGSHGAVSGPPRAVHEMLRTVLLSLAIGHPPDKVAFALLNCSDFHESNAYSGLHLLPHTAATVLDLSEPGTGSVASILKAERRHREAVLRDAGIETWAEYRADRNSPLDPLPALAVVLGVDRRLLDADPDLADDLARLTATGPDVGFRFIFYSREESTDIDRFDHLTRWRIELDDPADGEQATLRVEGRPDARFRPARVSAADADSLLAQMEQRGPRARQLTVHLPGGPVQTQPPLDIDVLRLNGAGPGEAFGETWALPATTPRKTTIGHHADGNALSFYPFDLSSGIPHGLIVGGTEARQRVNRAIVLALAAGYSPSDLRFAFAGMGEHPLGDPLPLPHVDYSESELLGRPEQLRHFLDYLSNEMDERAANTASDHPRLVVFTDVSLTFPSSRREVGETLVSLASRGRALGVQLLLSSETVENSTIWNRVMPLVGWRMAASPRPPAELQRVLGRATVSFPDERTAYLLAGGGVPRQLVLAPEPSRSAVDDFVERARGAEARPAPPVPPDIQLDQIDLEADTEATMDMLRRVFFPEPAPGEAPSRRIRHLILEGTDRARMARMARLYGWLLRDEGALSSGVVHEVPLLDSAGRPVGEPVPPWPGLFQENRGGVLLFHLSEIRHHAAPLWDGFVSELPRLMDEYGHDPMVVLCGDSDDVRELRRAAPSFASRFLVFDGYEPAPSTVREPYPRISIGVDSDTGEDVVLNFEADRHLLISGPPHSGKATLLNRLHDEIRAHARGLVYLLDGDDLIPGEEEEKITLEAPGDTVAAHEFGRLLGEAIDEAARHGTMTRGPDVFLLVKNHWGLFRSDPLLPLLDLLRSSPANGPRLVLSRHRTLLDMGGNLVKSWRDIGAPVLLTGDTGGREGDLWGLPRAVRGPIPRGQALLAYPGRHRFVTLRL